LRSRTREHAKQRRDEDQSWKYCEEKVVGELSCATEYVVIVDAGPNAFCELAFG
jgi:hypothetical protein